MILKENVINNWATALLKIAIEENLVDQFIEQADVLITVLKNRDDFAMILTYTNNKQKKQSVKLIDETFSSFGFNLYIINTMKLLVEKRAFIHFRDILKILYKNLLATKKIASGIVWSTDKLNKNQIKSIEVKISKRISKKVNLINKIDPSLIGGVKVYIEGKIFDGSIQAKLESMKYQAIKRE
ncbi:F0F1 ATP synthase subunit delta [Mycoplasma putrefaciens]|uniref:ATP synthase subunit delta n=1 Tax=Mycoplasma putrefaciens Mput9231 TaxID=1292033 RepID=M9WD17_9MOLU|nr:F0F1 ATP synthase subunit delta [Mycoplasma putrefaciens]AGJ91057.1 ATP synthase delta chain [Mycoplasma putrefaciens Mput9231]